MSSTEQKFSESVYSRIRIWKTTYRREKNEMWEFKINREKLKKIMKELDEKKPIGSDGVLEYILKRV